MSERIVEKADERGEFVRLEDGFLGYWPRGRGVITSQQLRILADELDHRNAAWEAQIKQDLSEEQPMEQKNTVVDVNRREELVREIAHAIRTYTGSEHIGSFAAAAWIVDIMLDEMRKTLEEAARVAEDHDPIGHHIAAAIRAMIPNGNEPAQDDTGNAR
jgi:hypothetical protein